MFSLLPCLTCLTGNKDNKKRGILRGSSSLWIGLRLFWNFARGISCLRCGRGGKTYGSGRPPGYRYHPGPYPGDPGRIPEGVYRDPRPFWEYQWNYIYYAIPWSGGIFFGVVLLFFYQKKKRERNKNGALSLIDIY